MSTTIVTQQEQGQHHPFLPLTVERMCRDEVYWLAREIRHTEKLSQWQAEREAVQALAELREYQEDWDLMAYRAGNSAGLPF